MPELPEVETIARGLRRALRGSVVRRVEVRRADVVRGGRAASLRKLAGRTIEDVSRRGKHLLVHLDGWRVVFHLGMSGQLLVEPGETPTGRHTHIVFHLEDARQLRHRDPRRFGFVEVVPPGSTPACLEGLGPEPLEIDQARMAEILRRHDRQLKPLLMDQRVVAGIGNIYADEILFRARLNPLTRSSRAGREAAGRLVEACRRTLREAIRRRGTTLRDYRTDTGRHGSFQDFLQVYGREGEPCVRCGSAIRRIRVAQRSAFFCPKCQPRR